jgi:copper chaperone CopZ
MTCGGCAIATRKVLTRLPGVSHIEVSHERQRAVVIYDPARLTIAQMIAAVGTLGYTASVIEGCGSKINNQRRGGETHHRNCRWATED